ncbi:Alpha/Beta hydrolase protein [Gloeopeniophorella convolvens]|nr:Alpha/Beta hydrolase protein [Gloeopeniophorella convolvens]
MAQGYLLVRLYVSLLGATLALSSRTPMGPTTIHLDDGIFIGNQTGNVTGFFGIPFAQPPLGNLRFRPPLANSPYTGVHNATQFGPTCIQQAGPSMDTSKLLIPGTTTVLGSSASTEPTDSEDCLLINVIKPTNAEHNINLPVLVWIYGGGFEQGGTSSFDGTVIVERSLALSEPVLYVSMGYRLSALGFPVGEEVKKAGVANLGLHDQRQAFRWVQKYIHAFGGDPAKVTIWGESAGAISAALQMVANGGNTEGLFRAAFMQSGAPPDNGGLELGQQFFDQFVAAAGCTNTIDKLECLRQVPINVVRAAQDASPSFTGFRSTNLVWTPRPDGTSFLPDDPQELVLKGSVANIPFVSGNCDDEGTLFAMPSLNVTTDTEVRDYFKTIFLPNASDSDLDALLTLYPNDTTVGSPFDTGAANALTPEFKRIAAIIGDETFHAQRRFFLQHRSDKQRIFSFREYPLRTSGNIWDPGPNIDNLMPFHSSDLQNVYGPGDMTDYLIRFAANLDPNGNTNIHWPQYTNESPQLLTFVDGDPAQIISQDTYRAEQIAFVTQLFLKNPFR